jgi:protocatechuate 3,4-dioxygenase beta subunit
MTTDPSGNYAQRTGVPLTMDIKLVNTNNNCAPLVGYDVYVWHCDADGYYSYYSNQPGYLGTKSYPNGYFLRAAQTSGACGEVTFTTIFPGWYTGRYAHLHIAVALGATQEAITQMTWPVDIISNVYANSSYYSAHGQNPTTLTSDNVFEGNNGQIATTTGSISAGYHSQWVVGISV